jgi:hypothetical protein
LLGGAGLLADTAGEMLTALTDTAVEIPPSGSVTMATTK